MDADFYRFKGRGVIQTTGRKGYIPLISIVNNYSGSNQFILGCKNKWSGMTADQIATASSNADWDAIFDVDEFVHLAVNSFGNTCMPAKGFIFNVQISDINSVNSTGKGSIWNVGYAVSWDNAYANLFTQRVMEIISTYNK